MKFTKMHGAGNDFIIINNIEEGFPREKLGLLAEKLCRRKFSIGADGLMAVEAPEEGGDFKMLFYNSDGSLGEMCGNGARCIARYGYEKGLAGEVQNIETTAGIVTGCRLSKRRYKIRLNDITEMKFGILCGEIECDYVELGTPGLPHAVVELQGLRDILNSPENIPETIKDMGKEMRFHKNFPKGANVNFYEVAGKDEIYELTYERGVEDFTLACGTGTGAVVSVLTKPGRVSGKNVCVHVPGGELFIDIEKENNAQSAIYLTGDTNIVAEGNILDEDLGFI